MLFIFHKADANPCLDIHQLGTPPPPPFSIRASNNNAFLFRVETQPSHFKIDTDKFLLTTIILYPFKEHLYYDMLKIKIQFPEIKLFVPSASENGTFWDD